jgi:hypothetical protein
MKIYKWKGGSVGYPVGSYMPGAINFAKGAAKAFNAATKGGVNDLTAINVWCRGSSGAILAALFIGHIKRTPNVNVCHIKKSGEESHTTTPRIWRQGDGITKVINIIIDDFISSGSTMQQIWKGIQSVYLNPPTIDFVIANNLTNFEDYEWGKWLGFEPSALITNN